MPGTATIVSLNDINGQSLNLMNETRGSNCEIAKYDASKSGTTTTTPGAAVVISSGNIHDITGDTSTNTVNGTLKLLQNINMSMASSLKVNGGIYNINEEMDRDDEYETLLRFK